MIIVIEGTDCSGKETQSKKLVEYLNNNGYKAKRYSFPNYDSPTGKIIGGSYLGKEHIGKCLFEEGATNVDYKVASLYYAADRLYNIDNIKKDIEDGYIIILDRYVYSNMAHQGCKEFDKEKRTKIYEWLEELEFDLLKLPIPEIRIFLYMPSEYTKILKQNREEKLDQHELNDSYIKKAEESYIEIANKYSFETINCIKDNKIKSIEDISEELIIYINHRLK